MATRRTAGRLRASLGLVSAVGLMVAVTCAVVAAIVVYRDAIVTQGVRSTIENASAPDRAIEATVRAPASDVAEVTDRLGSGAVGEFDTAVFAVSSSYRITEPPIDAASLPESTVDEPAIITRVATFTGDDLWQVVSGDLAPLEATDASTPVPAVLHADAASLLGLDIGDSVRLDPSTSGRADGIDLQVVAVVMPADLGDPRWFAQPFGRAGSSSSGSFVDVGPFFMSAIDFAEIGVR